MRALVAAGIAIILASSGLLADAPTLAGSLWRCTRAADKTQFIIAFYPGGGVGGGELFGGEVSPYVFDASRVEEGRWPGRWSQRQDRFTWSFPDQHMEIEGTTVAGQRVTKLTGIETSSGASVPVSCTALTRLPRIGEGLVIPKDGHFMDPDSQEGELKVPAGISLQAPRKAR
jgi:hypothetical protein